MCSAAAAAAKSLQSCPTLCDPIDGSPPGSDVPEVLPARKNTGVGCHFLLQCLKVKRGSEVTQSCPNSLQPYGLQPTRLLRPWDFPGKSTGVGCHCLLHLVAYPPLYSGKVTNNDGFFIEMHFFYNYFTFTFHFHALAKEMATHSSVLAWRIPGTGEPGGLPSMGSHRVGHD